MRLKAAGCLMVHRQWAAWQVIPYGTASHVFCVGSFHVHQPACELTYEQHTLLLHSTATLLIMTSSSSSAITLVHDSSQVDCYIVCKSYTQLYSHRHLDCVTKLLSCISSYNNNHHCNSIDEAFTAHRRRTLIKSRKKRRQDGGRDTDNAQHALEIECIQRELDQCRGQLRRAQAERDELKREVDEWRDAARTAQQQREALKQQLVDAVGPLPITAEPPKRDRVSQPQLTSFFARSKKRQRRGY